MFAAGDVRYGSVKRVASAVGEGAMAVQLVNQYRAELAEGRGEDYSDDRAASSASAFDS